MFGFSKEILLKKELLYFLDKQEEGVSSKDISDYIQSLTSQTVRKYLKEIAESISELYSPEQMQLNIGTIYYEKEPILIVILKNFILKILCIISINN
jgi:hypothetical protein